MNNLPSELLLSILSATTPLGAKSLLALSSVSKRIHTIYQKNATHLLALVAKAEIPRLAPDEDKGIYSAALVLANVGLFLAKLREAYDLGNGTYEERDMNPKGPEILRTYVADTLSTPATPLLLSKALKNHYRLRRLCALLIPFDQRLDIPVGQPFYALFDYLRETEALVDMWLPSAYQFALVKTFVQEYTETPENLMQIPPSWREMGVKVEVGSRGYTFGTALSESLRHLRFPERSRGYYGETLRFLRGLWDDALMSDDVGDIQTRRCFFSNHHRAETIERIRADQNLSTQAFDDNVGLAGSEFLRMPGQDVLRKPFKETYVYPWERILVMLCRKDEEARAQYANEWVREYGEEIRMRFKKHLREAVFRPFVLKCGTGLSDEMLRNMM